MFGSQPGSWASGGHMYARRLNEPAPQGITIGSQPLVGSQDASMVMAQERPLSAPSPSAAPVRGQVANKPFSYLQRPTSAPQGMQGGRLGTSHLNKAPVTGLVLGSTTNTLNLGGSSSQGTVAAASPTSSFYLQQSQSQNWTRSEAQEANNGLINSTQVSQYTTSAALHLGKQNNLARTQQLVATKPGVQLVGCGNQQVATRPGSANNSIDSSHGPLQQQNRPGSAPPESQGGALTFGQTTSMPQQTLARTLTSEVTSKKTLDALVLIENRTARLQEGQTTLAATLATMTEQQQAQAADVNERVSNIAATLYNVQQLMQDSMKQMQAISSNYEQHHQLFLEHTQEARTTIVKVQDAIVQTSPMQLSTAEFARDAATTPISTGIRTVHRMRHSSRVIHSTVVDEVVYEAAAVVGSQRLSPSPRLLPCNLDGTQAHMYGSAEVHERCHRAAFSEKQEYRQGCAVDATNTMQQQTGSVQKPACVPGSLRAALQEFQQQPGPPIVANPDDGPGWMSKKRPAGGDCPPVVKQRAVLPVYHIQSRCDKPKVIQQAGQHPNVDASAKVGTVNHQTAARGPSSVASLRGLLTGRPQTHSSASLLQRKPLAGDNAAADMQPAATLKPSKLSHGTAVRTGTDTAGYDAVPRVEPTHQGLGNPGSSKRDVVPGALTKSSSYSVLPSQSAHDVELLTQPQSGDAVEDDNELAQIVAERMNKHRQRRKRRL